MEKACRDVDRCEPKVFGQWREINGERVNGVRAGLYERSHFGGPWYPVKDQPRLNAETREFHSITPVPYRLPELRESAAAPVLIPGGEKDVDNLRALSLTATSNHGGEGKWWPELTPYFKGRRVFLLCDNDEQGEAHQAVVGAALKVLPKQSRLFASPSCLRRVTFRIDRAPREGRPRRQGNHRKLAERISDEAPHGSRHS